MTFMTFINANNKCLAIMIACGMSLLLATEVGVVVLHLGAMVGSVSDGQTKARIRETSVCHRTYIYRDGESSYHN